jgi:hypothetical protein
MNHMKVLNNNNTMHNPYLMQQVYNHTVNHYSLQNESKGNYESVYNRLVKT